VDFKLRHLHIDHACNVSRVLDRVVNALRRQIAQSNESFSHFVFRSHIKLVASEAPAGRIFQTLPCLYGKKDIMGICIILIDIVRVVCGDQWNAESAAHFNRPVIADLLDVNTILDK